MKTSKTFLLFEKSIEEETPKKLNPRRLFKSIVVLFIISWITILSSCAVFVPVPVPGLEGERHEQGGHRGQGEHHGQGEHRGNNEHHD